jgi:hypothetical protein
MANRVAAELESRVQKHDGLLNDPHQRGLNVSALLSSRSDFLIDADYSPMGQGLPRNLDDRYS